MNTFFSTGLVDKETENFPEHAETDISTMDETGGVCKLMQLVIKILKEVSHIELNDE